MSELSAKYWPGDGLRSPAVLKVWETRAGILNLFLVMLLGGGEMLLENKVKSRGCVRTPSGTSSPAGSPDSRYIRVETCMFMIKLPQYSSLDIMLEKLRYAIHYREDPLSG